MTVAASLAASTTPRRRMALAMKFALALIGLVTLVLLINGLINVWLSYEEAKRASVRVQREKAQAAAERIDLFVSGIEQQLGWTTRAEWARIPVEQRRYDFIRLLRQAPAITELIHVDGAGKEQLRLSRLEPDVVGSGADYAADPRFTKAIENKIWFGPVTFRRGSEPYTTIALTHGGRTPGVTIAEVNLKLIWDVVTSIKIGEAGYAFITDINGRLVAHPDMSLVLRETDLSKLPHITRAIAGSSTAASTIDVTTSTGLDGKTVLAASAPIARLKWFVFVQVPAAEALAPVYASLAQTAALLGLGIVLASVMGGLLAQRMVVPIRALAAGASKIGGGALDHRINIDKGLGSDDFQSLADSFNDMGRRLKESYAGLESKVEARTHDLNEALVYQTGSSNILKVIASSPTDVAPVLKAIVDSACEVCNAQDASVMLKDGDVLRFSAHRGPIPIGIPSWPINRNWAAGRAILDKVPVHVRDLRGPEGDAFPDGRELSMRMGHRTILSVPLLREGQSVGAVSLRRSEVHPFSDKQIGLLQTFADQAVIAIGNVRMFDEVQARTRDLGEALRFQTATADVLKVISRSPNDLQPVLEVIVATALELCGSEGASIWLLQGDGYVLTAVAGELRAADKQSFLTKPIKADQRGSSTTRAARERRTVHIPDSSLDPEFGQGPMGVGQPRALLSVPLLRDGAAVGVLTMPQAIAKPFTPRQIELAETFADQAVIAINNTRLFNETKEALEQQKASAEILSVISSSVSDTNPVFDKILESCRHIFGSDETAVLLVDDNDVVTLGAYVGKFREAVAATFPAPLEKSMAGRAIRERRVAHYTDVVNDGSVTRAVRRVAEVAGYQSMAYSPMMWNERGIGAVGVSRLRGVFADKELALLQTFADQAVIAIQNARLFNETKEALEQQTATSDVLKVISRSTFDLDAVFQTLIESAARLCNAQICILFRRDGELMRVAASFGGNREFVQFLKQNPNAIDRGSVSGRAALERQTIHVPNIEADPDYQTKQSFKLGGWRSIIGVPLMRQGEPIGVLALARPTVGPFNQREIELVETFADQAVIAIENVRLFQQVEARTQELSVSLDDLKKTQDRLVQTEKLASLGALTAGIAHEIKNPLNFVNNFAALSGELLGELDAALKPAPLNDNTRAEINELTTMLKGNLEKVVQHGKRADSIVKNMLLHSREGSGEHRPVDVNALVEESVNLAYHGARAEKPGFNITLEKNLDPAAGDVDLFPQEITRVLLNLVTNGFYAATKRGKENGAASYEPTLSAATRNLGDRVEIRIRDNGSGIPPEVRAKMFNPFFTTKPAGEGTGLGLSLSHDIVVKQHGGTIEVETEPGEFTEFTVTLPRILAKQIVTGNSQ